MSTALIDEILSRCHGRLLRRPNGRITRSGSGWASRGGTARPPLPQPPRQLQCPGSIARTGFDLRSANAVSGLLARSDVSEDEGGRYLLIDSGCGHLVHTLMATRPASRWVGLDRNAEAVAWSAGNVAGAAFAVLPDEPALREEDASFDGAVALELSKRLDADRLGEWLEELWRVVRPGGFLVLGAHGYAALADLAQRRHADDDDLHAAFRTLDATGMATLSQGDQKIRLFGEDRLAREIAGRHWQSFQPMIGAGPRLTDLHLARRCDTRRTSGEAVALPPIGTVIEGTVDAATLAALPGSKPSRARC